MSRKLISLMIQPRFAVLADQLVFSGTSFLLTILLARLLKADVFGSYASIVLMLFLVISLFNAMVIQPLQVSLAGVADKKAYINFSFWSQLLLVMLLSVTIAGALSIDIALLQPYLPEAPGLILYAAGFVMHDYFRKLFLADARTTAALSIDLVLLISTAFSMLLIYNSQQPELSSTLVLLGLSYLPSFIAGIVMIKPFDGAMIQWKKYISMHYLQSKWLVMSAIIQWWSGNLFVVVSGVFLGVEALGAFRLVQSLFGVLNIFLQTIENYALPQASRLLIHSTSTARKYLQQISVKGLLVFSSVLTILFFFAREVIVLAGGEAYASYAYVVKGMAVLYVFVFVGTPIRIAIRMFVLNRSFFVGYVLSLGFSLLTFRFLLNQWGLAGAIAGLIGSQLIVLTYWQITLHKKQFYLWK